MCERRDVDSLFPRGDSRQPVAGEIETFVTPSNLLTAPCFDQSTSLVQSRLPPGAPIPVRRKN
jgi:hypothetical protein